ncbi:MAG: hypothetical protein AAGA81_21790 [Acidobacteriota bacterium]
MKNVLIAGILAGVALFVWGALFWAVLPTANLGFASLDADTSAELGRAVQTSVTEAGTYLLPDAELPFEEYQNRHLDGPVAMLFVQPGGMQAMPPSTFGKGLLHFVLVGILAAALLKMTSPAFTGFAQRFLFVVLCFGLAVALTDLNGPIWWHNPPAFHAVTALFHLSGGALAAAVLAFFVSDNA